MHTPPDKQARPIAGIVRQQHVPEAKLARVKSLRAAMTPEEQLLWRCLRGNRVYGFHFRRQQVIGGYIADFYCHAARLVIEIDGEIHLQQQEYDRMRDDALLAMGLRLLRFRNADVRHELAAVLRQITLACAQGSSEAAIGESSHAARLPNPQPLPSREGEL